MNRALLYAIGIGAAVNVLVAVVERLVRGSGGRLEVNDEAVVVGVATAIVVASLGAAARADVGRLALVGLAAPVSIVINRVLGVATSGRAPGDPVSTDAFVFAPRALAALAAALVIGAAVGAILRAYAPQLRRRPPERLFVPVGVAYVVGAVASLVWPASFLGQLLGDADLAVTLVSVPLVLSAPLAGGIYAARNGVGYRDIALLGAYLTLPVFITLVLGTATELARLRDPRFDAIASQIRATIALSWFLVALRIGAWPLGAAFAHGFLVEERPAPPESAPLDE